MFNKKLECSKSALFSAISCVKLIETLNGKLNVTYTMNKYRTS